MDVVKEVLDMYCGCHDFAAFTKRTLQTPWKLTKRVVDEIKFYESPFNPFFNDPQCSNIIMWEFYFKSVGFLYHQVRSSIYTVN